MNATSVKILILSGLRDWGFSVLAILGSFLTIGLGYFIFRYGFAMIWHSDGTTNWLGSHWSWYDQMTYKPYPKYNRFRSRQWNLGHTMD
jgi:hypothetical protein